jgi:hypothetical protein
VCARVMGWCRFYRSFELVREGEARELTVGMAVTFRGRQLKLTQLQSKISFFFAVITYFYVLLKNKYKNE